VKRVAVLLAVALATPVVVPWAAPPSAAGTREEARQREIARTIDAVREELDEVAAEEADLLAELRATQARRAEEDRRIAELDAEIAAAQADLDAAQRQLDAAITDELEARHRAQRAVDELERAQTAFSDQAVSAYIHDSRFEPPRLLATPEHVAEMSSARALVDALNDKQANLIAELEDLEEEAADLRRAAERARGAAASVRDDVGSRAAALEAARQAQAESRSKLAAEAANEERLLAQARGERQSYERRIRDLQAESDSIASLLRRRSSGGPAIRGNGSLSSPLARPVITSTFGYRIHPIYGDRRLHAGIDMRGANGTPIYASAPGEVVFAGTRGGYGSTVIIDHGGGIATLYAHQSKLAVAAGDEVARGQVIGAVGSTGFSTGPHLHFEVRARGVPVDPLGYL
jgi:murein DD-endopeptidase MepM/ murein hydrolase activator NlpD